MEINAITVIIKYTHKILVDQVELFFTIGMTRNIKMVKCVEENKILSVFLTKNISR